MAFLQSADLGIAAERPNRPALRPWRGTLVIHGLQTDVDDMPQGLIATAVETDGNTYVCKANLLLSIFVLTDCEVARSSGHPPLWCSHHNNHQY